ncbi:hypothetical protein FRC17_003994 [Serendipita sp. 399]|nr:hypothetical protein FRC17_003994 [Serendipita sp. 399]
MADKRLLIKSETLADLFKKTTPAFSNFYRMIQHVAGGSVDPPKDRYPLFEHLIVFLYCRCVTSLASKKELFGPRLSVEQRTNIGEAMDILLHQKLIPQDSSLGFCLSFLYLCHHERFGFKDDPVLLQRMWYIRSYIILSDVENKVDPGQRFKWYDSRLTLAIYSWVRHNRGYHGCPKKGCNCRRMIDLYLVPINIFKAMYMAVEEVCITQLAYVRAKDSVWPITEGGESLSRAVEAGLYITPNRKVWPACLVKHVASPDPPLKRTPSSNPLNVEAKQGKINTRSSSSVAPSPTPISGDRIPIKTESVVSTDNVRAAPSDEATSSQTVKSEDTDTGHRLTRATSSTLGGTGGTDQHPLPGVGGTNVSETAETRPVMPPSTSADTPSTNHRRTGSSATLAAKPPRPSVGSMRPPWTGKKSGTAGPPPVGFTQNAIGVLVPKRRRLSSAGGEPQAADGPSGKDQVPHEPSTPLAASSTAVPMDLSSPTSLMITDPQSASGTDISRGDDEKAQEETNDLRREEFNNVTSINPTVRTPTEASALQKGTMATRKRQHAELEESDRALESHLAPISPSTASISNDDILSEVSLLSRAKMKENAASSSAQDTMLAPDNSISTEMRPSTSASEVEGVSPRSAKTTEDESIAAANAMSSTLKILSHLAGKNLSDKGDTGDDDTSTTSSRSKSSRISKPTTGKRKRPSLGVKSPSNVSTPSRANSVRFLTPSSPATLPKSQNPMTELQANGSNLGSVTPLLPKEVNTENCGEMKVQAASTISSDDERITHIMTGINSDKPVSFSSSDESLQLLLPTQEARRLICILVGLGIPLEWDMVAISRDGITICDENRELVTSHLTEECLKTLNGRGINVSIGRGELLSQDEVNELLNTSVVHRLEGSPEKLDDLTGQLSFVDTRCERWRRSSHWESIRLQNLLRTVLKMVIPPNEDKDQLDLGVQINHQYRALGFLLALNISQQLTAEDISNLSLHGLAAFRGYSQVGGPILPCAAPTVTQKEEPSPFDWRALRTEVLKMKLPWESTGGSTHSAISLHSPSLSYPYVFKPLSKMATAGIRWITDEYDLDSDSSDADSDLQFGKLRSVVHF